MFTVVATLNIQPDRVAEYEALYLDMLKGIRANEPWTRFFQLVRSRETPGAYTVIEVYEDEDGLRKHRQSPHFKAIAPRIMALFAAPSQIASGDAVE